MEVRAVLPADDFAPEEPFLLPPTTAVVAAVCCRLLLARLSLPPELISCPFGKPSDMWAGRGEGVEVLRSVLGERAAFWLWILNAAKYSVNAAVIIGLLPIAAIFGIWLNSFKYCWYKVDEFTAPVADEVDACAGGVTDGKGSDAPDGSAMCRSVADDVVENPADFAAVVETVVAVEEVEAVTLPELLAPTGEDDTGSCIIGVMVTREDSSDIMLVIAVCPYCCVAG